MSIQIKRGSTNSWTTQNPVLLDGQPGLENREGGLPPRLKFGDGSTQWTDLPYAAPDAEIYQDTKIVNQDSAFEIAARGIALDSSDYITLHANSGSTGLLIDSWSVSPNGSGASNMTLGNAANPWSEIYTKKICNNSTDGLGIAFTNISSSPIFKFTTNGFEPGGAYNLGSSTAAWQRTYTNNIIGLTSASLNIINTANSDIFIGSSYGESDIYQSYGFTITSSSNSSMQYPALLPTNSSKEYAPYLGAALGSTSYPFTDLYLNMQSYSSYGVGGIHFNNGTVKGMDIIYNASEECIEFLAN